MKLKKVTQIVVTVGLIIWILWDIIAYCVAGGEATISTLVGKVMWKSLWALAILGGLGGHFIGSMPSVNVYHLVVFFLAMFLSYICTRGF